MRDLLRLCVIYNWDLKSHITVSLTFIFMNHWIKAAFPSELGRHIVCASKPLQAAELEQGARCKIFILYMFYIMQNYKGRF